MSKSKQANNLDYYYNPEVTCILADGKQIDYLNYPCFDYLSRLPGIKTFTYHCHDLLSTILGTTEFGDIFLKDFEEYSVFKAHKDKVSIEVDPDHNPHRYVRAINLTVDASKINYEEFLLIASVLRSFQECPSHIMGYLKVKEYLPDKSFLYNWLVAQWIDDKEYPHTKFSKVGNEATYPNPDRLQGHGIIYSPLLQPFPEEVNNEILLDKAHKQIAKPIMASTKNHTQIYQHVCDSLGWPWKTSVENSTILPASEENIDRILKGNLQNA